MVFRYDETPVSEAKLLRIPASTAKAKNSLPLFDLDQLMIYPVLRASFFAAPCDHFLPRKRMRPVKPRPVYPLKVRNCGESTSLLTFP